MSSQSIACVKEVTRLVERAKSVGVNVGTDFLSRIALKQFIIIAIAFGCNEIWPYPSFLQLFANAFLSDGVVQEDLLSDSVLRVCGIAIVIELCGSIAIVYVLFCYFTSEFNFRNHVL